MPRLGTVPDENIASTLSGGPQPGVEGAIVIGVASFDCTSPPKLLGRLRSALDALLSDETEWLPLNGGIR